MAKFAAANIWHTPSFFLFYFIWKRVFLFIAATAGTAQPKMRYIILLAAVSMAATLLPGIRKAVYRLIHEYIKPKYLERRTATRIAIITLSVVLGPVIMTLGYGAETALLSAILTALGSILAVFVTLLCMSARLKRLGGYVIKALSAFKDVRFIAAVLLLNAYAVIYLLTARQAFFWDNAGYWRMAADLSEMVFRSPLEFIRTIVNSVFTSDYHLLPAVVPACVMAVFNTSRMAFILAIVNFYVVPLWAVLYAVVQANGRCKGSAADGTQAATDGTQAASDETQATSGGTQAASDGTQAAVTEPAGIAKHTRRPPGFIRFVIAAAGLFFVPYLAVVGFPDVGGVVFAFSCAYLFFYSGDDGFLSGLLLCASMMFRRWFVFYAIVFLVLALVYTLLDKGRRSRLVWLLFGFGAPMVLIFQGYVSGVLLRENFAEIYEAYSFALSTDIKFTLYYFGIVFILAAAVYSVYSAIKTKGRFTAAWPLLCAVLVFLLFVSVQSFGMQHLLLFAAPFGIVCVKAPSERRLKLPALGITALCLISVFIPREQPGSIHEIKGYSVLPSYSVYPQIREDAGALVALDAYVRELDGPVAVLASSFTLNPDLLSLVGPSFDPLSPLRANGQVMQLGAVDKRDGLPYALEFAEYLVVADPVQTHLDPGQQRIVTVPAGAVVKGSPFSAAFERLDAEFILQNQTAVFVFKRTRPNTAEELEWLWQEIRP